jgi:hypothetical protein
MSLNFDGQKGDYLHKNNSNSFYIFLPFSFQLELVCKHGFPCDFKKIIYFLIFFYSFNRLILKNKYLKNITYIYFYVKNIFLKKLLL